MDFIKLNKRRWKCTRWKKHTPENFHFSIRNSMETLTHPWLRVPWIWIQVTVFSFNRGEHTAFFVWITYLIASAVCNLAIINPHKGADWAVELQFKVPLHQLQFKFIHMYFSMKRINFVCKRSLHSVHKVLVYTKCTQTQDFSRSRKQMWNLREEVKEERATFVSCSN